MSVAYSINDNGYIAGFADDADGWFYATRNANGVAESFFACRYSMAECPEGAPPSRRAHEEWLECQGQWKNLI